MCHATSAALAHVPDLLRAVGLLQESDVQHDTTAHAAEVVAVRLLYAVIPLHILGLRVDPISRNEVHIATNIRHPPTSPCATNRMWYLDSIDIQWVESPIAPFLPRKLVKKILRVKVGLRFVHLLKVHRLLPYL